MSQIERCEKGRCTRDVNHEGECSPAWEPRSSRELALEFGRAVFADIKKEFKRQRNGEDGPFGDPI